MTKSKSVKRMLALLLFSLFISTGCDWKNFIPIYGWLPRGSADPYIHRERAVSGKITIALGGMHSPSDEFVFASTLNVNGVRNEDSDLFEVVPRVGFSSIAEGMGVKIVPIKEGIGYFIPMSNGVDLEPVEVTIPPQTLIQIFVGEARGEMANEATLENDQVKTTSVSVTADALGAVIRNRITLINETSNPSLFVADSTEYESNPPISFYEAVIEGHQGSVYQFSPVNPSDPSYDEYTQAADRDEVSSDLLRSYDQAVFTAGSIFNDDTTDPTEESFAFYSPTPAQWSLLQQSLENGDRNLPEGCGTSDENFPALAPIQVRVVADVAPSGTNEGVPSFVFIRSRNSADPAVKGP